MKITFDNFQKIKYAFTSVAVVIVCLSVYFTNQLINDMAEEESRKMELWAEATRKIVSDDETTDYSFVLKVIADNTTIPVIVADQNGEVTQYRNIDLEGKDTVSCLMELIGDFRDAHEPIEIVLDESTSQFLYYDDSVLLKKLLYYPYIQWGVIVLFFLILFFVFASAKKAEQDRVWVGLSKETAHQLGTPISSLMAWVELLKSKGVEPQLMPEMENDVNRLSTIAERFSKIGSKPELELISLDDVLDGALAYMDRRTSSRVTISDEYKVQRPVKLMLNVPLFEWVIENLCKNAIDAMEGKGAINVVVSDCGDKICIDVSDTGKGIPRSKFGTVFNPGYTTKKRGWGVGLSLVKRIVESYHEGKIFVKRSEINKGTTFRILLPKRMNSKASETRNL
ncbi:MAG: HAMP domain-containing sensor histidine kinase [Paludibacteraceae bacterium]|jgi:signal transduction histidine kinase|nr:HAMP domain-containing histidine kinase [Paludibacteraceae bacterium]MEE1540913.1 HAMP domain-containing sensor histidine kinase [Paludibacteraceae bacterium]